MICAGPGKSREESSAGESPGDVKLPPAVQGTACSKKMPVEATNTQTGVESRWRRFGAVVFTAPADFVLSVLESTPKSVLGLLTLYLLWTLHSAPPTDGEFEESSWWTHIPVIRQVGMAMGDAYAYLDASFTLVLKGGGVKQFRDCLRTCASEDSEWRAFSWELWDSAARLFGLMKALR